MTIQIAIIIGFLAGFYALETSGANTIAISIFGVSITNVGLFAIAFALIVMVYRIKIDELEAIEAKYETKQKRDVLQKTLGKVFYQLIAGIAFINDNPELISLIQLIILIILALLILFLLTPTIYYYYPPQPVFPAHTIS